MEGDTFNDSQIGNTQGATQAVSLPKLSFIPEALIKKYEGPLEAKEKCAYIGLVAGGASLVVWVVILLGLITSVSGIVLSVMGLRSRRSKYSRMGLTLSIVGLVASLGYAFAISQGRVNYGYFTSEFWGASSEIEAGSK